MEDTSFVSDLCARFNAGAQMDFLFFWGHRPDPRGPSASCFSQWYEAAFVVDGQHYSSAEHFMMAEKAALFGDLPTRAKILSAPNPGAAKSLGRSVAGFDEAAWAAQRFALVVRGNQAKFSQNPALGQFLKHTGSRILVEASPVDRIWGIGLAKNAPGVNNPNLWNGLNLLGFALMQVRDSL